MRSIVVVVGILVVGLQYKYWFGESGYFAVEELRQRLHSQERFNQRLQERNKVLRAEVLALQDGNDAVEAIARTDLGMVAQGETFYLVVEEP